ncbi:MAG: hypothetical protein IID31_04665 [Planctomycetes bacterium]|nr:hypothetical protein [Planctomycetota bacterium]
MDLDTLEDRHRVDAAWAYLLAIAENARRLGEFPGLVPELWSVPPARRRLDGQVPLQWRVLCEEVLTCHAGEAEMWLRIVEADLRTTGLIQPAFVAYRCWTSCSPSFPYHEVQHLDFLKISTRLRELTEAWWVEHRGDAPRPAAFEIMREAGWIMPDIGSAETHPDRHVVAAAPTVAEAEQIVRILQRRFADAAENPWFYVIAAGGMDETEAEALRLEAEVPESPTRLDGEIRLAVALLMGRQAAEDSGVANATPVDLDPLPDRAPVYKPDGWTKSELVYQADDAAGSFSPSTFDAVRKAAHVEAGPKGGAGPHHRFSRAELGAMIEAIESGTFRNRQPIGAAWRELLGK